MTRILAVSAGLSQPSSTRLLTDRLVSATREELGADVEIETVELREYAHEIADGLLAGFPAGRLRTVLDQVAASDGLILVTPTFSASYSGLFKSFMDVVEPEAVQGKPVLVGATGGTERHSLVLEHALRPLLSYLRAVMVPTAVYAASADWGNDRDLGSRITRAAGEFATLLVRQPVTERPDEFADPVPFEQLLRDATG